VVLGLAAEEAQVDGEHEEDEKEEASPEQKFVVHGVRCTKPQKNP
jgi:hypothetical protein